MKIKLPIIILLVLSGVLSSFKLDNSEKKIIGSWKVETVVRNDGSTKNGKKILTFSGDKTFVSLKDNGSKMKGYWKYDDDSKILSISDETKENWQEFEVLKLTNKELILKDDKKTYNTVKNKTLGRL